MQDGDVGRIVERVNPMDETDLTLDQLHRFWDEAEPVDLVEPREFHSNRLVGNHRIEKLTTITTDNLFREETSVK